MKLQVYKMLDQIILDRVEMIREEASRHVNVRLSRGSLRLQDGAYASAAEWNRRGRDQAARVARINAKLK